MRVNLVYFVLDKLIHCYFPTAKLIDSNVRTELVGNNMHYFILDIPIVLTYLIHDMNESMHKQGQNVALIDQALDIN